MKLQKGDLVVIMTSLLWFPGGVIHEVEVRAVAGSFVKVRGYKPWLWPFHKKMRTKEFWISGGDVLSVLHSAEVCELERLANL